MTDSSPQSSCSARRSALDAIQLYVRTLFGTCRLPSILRNHANNRVFASFRVREARISNPPVGGSSPPGCVWTYENLPVRAVAQLIAQLRGKAVLA